MTHHSNNAQIASPEQEALSACREAFEQIHAHCYPFPLQNSAGKSLSMENIDKAGRLLALAALASRQHFREVQPDGTTVDVDPSDMASTAPEQSAKGLTMGGEDAK